MHMYDARKNVRENRAITHILKGEMRFATETSLEIFPRGLFYFFGNWLQFLAKRADARGHSFFLQVAPIPMRPHSSFRLLLAGLTRLYRTSLWRSLAGAMRSLSIYPPRVRYLTR
jgi:hypothetical protein